MSAEHKVEDIASKTAGSNVAPTRQRTTSGEGGPQEGVTSHAGIHSQQQRRPSNERQSSGGGVPSRTSSAPPDDHTHPPSSSGYHPVKTTPSFQPHRQHSGPPVPVIHVAPAFGGVPDGSQRGRALSGEYREEMTYHNGPPQPYPLQQMPPQGHPNNYRGQTYPQQNRVPGGYHQPIQGRVVGPPMAPNYVPIVQVGIPQRGVPVSPQMHPQVYQQQPPLPPHLVQVYTNNAPALPFPPNQAYYSYGPGARDDRMIYPGRQDLMPGQLVASLPSDHHHHGVPHGGPHVYSYPPPGPGYHPPDQVNKPQKSRVSVVFKDKSGKEVDLLTLKSGTGGSAAPAKAAETETKSTPSPAPATAVQIEVKAEARSAIASEAVLEDNVTDVVDQDPGAKIAEPVVTDDTVGAKLEEFKMVAADCPSSMLSEGYGDIIIESPDGEVTEFSGSSGAVMSKAEVEPANVDRPLSPKVGSVGETNLNEGLGDSMIESPAGDDLEASSVSEKMIDVTIGRVNEESSKGFINVETRKSSGDDLSDFIEEAPEGIVIGSIAEEKQESVVYAASDLISSASPVATAATAGAEEEEEWENSMIPDISKMQIASKGSPTSALTATSNEFIFPTSKTGDNDSVKRNKKSSKRDKYATADAAADSGLLDAYTETSSGNNSPAPGAMVSGGSKASLGTSAAPAKQQNASKNAPPKTSKTHPQKASPVTVQQALVQKVEAGTVATDREPSLAAVVVEKKPFAIYVPPVASSYAAAETSSSGPRRSLRPGGGKVQEALNAPGNQASKPRVVYSKKELKALLPNPMYDRPPVMQPYDTITVTEGGSVTVIKSVCMGGIPQPSDRLVGGGKSTGGSSSDKWNKQQPQPGSAADERHPSGGSTHSPAAPFGFVPPPSHSNHSPLPYRQGGGRNKRIPPPMPRKQYDQLEKYKRDVQGILNKISPLNLEKLLNDLCNIPCESIGMLKLMIDLIFEKALQEQSFSKLYADMCFYVEHQSPHILANTFHVVYNEQTLQYKWLGDVKFPMEFAGPFATELDALAAMTSTPQPPMAPVYVAPLVQVSVIMRGEVIIQVAKAIDRESFFCNRLTVEQVGPASFSERLFPTFDAASRDFIKKHGFKRTLVTACQTEFIDSANSVDGRYKEADDRIRNFELNQHCLTEEERQREAAEIEELEGKVKRRMLGNIRFIGELFKSNMLREPNIFDCLNTLMQSETGESWRPMNERTIEILCKLLTTVGGDIKEYAKLNPYFQRMQELSVDKTLNSRMRFMLMEVIELRRNRWVVREVTTDKNAYKGGFIHTLLPPDTPVVRHIHNLPNVEPSALVSDYGLSRRPRSGSGSAVQSPMELRGVNSPGQAGLGTPSSIAPTLFSTPPSVPMRQGSPSMQLAPGVATRGTPQTGMPPTGSSGKQAGATGARAIAGSVDAATWRSPSPGNNISAAPDDLRTPVASKRRVKDIGGVIVEFLSLEPDHPDAEFSVEDLRQCPPGEVVIKLLEKAVDAKPSEMIGILRLADSLSSFLSASLADVASAIESFEPLQVLGDTVVDSKQAPEQLGKTLGVLIKGGACSRDALLGLIDKFEAASLDDEYGTPDVIKSAFFRFKTAAALH